MSSWFQQREYQSFCFCSTGDLSTSRGRIGATGWWPSWNVFFPAQETGEAVLRVVTNTGNSSNPAGRLPYTWPKYQDQVRNKRVLHFAYWDCWVVFLSVGNVHIFRLNCLVNSNITATSTTNLHIPRLLYKIKPILLLIKYNSAKNKASEKKTTL